VIKQELLEGHVAAVRDERVDQVAVAGLAEAGTDGTRLEIKEAGDGGAMKAESELV